MCRASARLNALRVGWGKPLLAALGGRSTAVRPVRGTLREINCKGECDCTATSIHLRVPGATASFRLHDARGHIQKLYRTREGGRREGGLEIFCGRVAWLGLLNVARSERDFNKITPECQDQPLQLCKAKVHDCLCRVKFYGIFSKNPRISGIEECYRSYRGKTTGAACGICRQHNRTKNGRVNAETPAKKKPRLA